MISTPKTTKTFLRKTKEVINKWRGILRVRIVRLHIGKISILPKLIHSFNAIPFKMPVGFFFSYLCGNSNVSYEIILKKENEVGALTLPDFKTYYKVIVSKRVWHWHKDRQICQ